MNKYTTYIDVAIPTFNESIDLAKTHKMKYSRRKEEVVENICYFIQRIPTLDRIYLKLTWMEPNRRYDPDNIASGIKYILDALQAADIIKNDGWKQVAGWENHFEVQKNKERGVLMEIEEA